MIDTSVTDDKRACIFCGEYSPVPTRSLTVPEVNDLMSCVEEDAVFHVTSNIINSASQFFERYGSNDTETRVVSCMCCQHWILRRRKRKTTGLATHSMLPLQALQKYVRCLDISSEEDRTEKGEQLDARVVFRLASTLTQKVKEAKFNYFKTLFREEEMHLFSIISKHEPQRAHELTATHYFQANAGTSFYVSANVAELLRGARKDSLANCIFI